MALLSLFTTPTTTPAAPAATGTVADAVRAGAQRSGVGFDFLLKTARRESALDPNARAGTSTATGLFQFIEQTWLQTVKLDGAKHGLQRYADAITSANGRYSVADPAVRAEILALRRDPQTSSALAGELTRRNGAALADQLGRQPTDGELYLAHVMGSRGANALIRRAAAAPEGKAASAFPDEAAANRNIFYTRTGRARTLAEVRDRLTDGFGPDAATVATAATAATPLAASGAWLAYIPQASANAARPVDSLFRTEGPRGPVSSTVARLWSPRSVAEPSADSYFPTGSGEALPVPTPPARRAAPAESAKPSETTTVQPATQQPRRKRAPGRPLDLQALMKPVAT